MLTRILTASALLPLLAVVYFGPSWAFLGLATAAGIAVTWEALRLQEARGRRPLRKPAVAGVVLLNLAFHDPGHLEPVGALVLGMALITAAQLLVRDAVDDALDAVGATVTCLLAPGLLLAFQVALRQVGPVESGPAVGLLMFLYAAIFGHDAGAYFTGRFLGRTRLAPRISPNKTVEGLLGGLALGTGLGVLVARWLLPELPAATAAFEAALLSMAAALGDLTVSLWKRSAGVKDAGASLPGHGGFLDRLAGLLWASPLFYFMVTGGTRLAAALPHVRAAGVHSCAA